jgi:cysteine desulfurase/selenocysteine lyase
MRKRKINLDEIKEKFPFFKQNSNYVYLDSASTGLILDEVIQSIIIFYTKEKINTNGINEISNSILQKIKLSRELTAKMLNAEIEEIVFFYSATSALNQISFSLGKFINKNDEIILTYAEHTSNLLP